MGALRARLLFYFQALANRALLIACLGLRSLKIQCLRAVTLPSRQSFKNIEAGDLTGGNRVRSWRPAEEAD